MKRRGWVSGGGPVLVGVAATALLLAGCSGGATGGSSSVPSSTASAGPTISAAPAPTPSPAPPGFFPVDSLGASAIPWEEVGPGWFLVEWVEHEASYSGDSGEPVTPSEFSVSLLSPDGTWYTGRALGTPGADARTTFWLGDSVAVFRRAPAPGRGVFGFTGDTYLVNLRDGSTRPAISDHESPSWFAMGANGTLIGAHALEGGPSTSYSQWDTNFDQTPVCGDLYPSTVALSPDGTHLVCVAGDSGDPGTTAVWLGDVGSGDATTRVGTLDPGTYRYSIDGWLDSDTFLLEREDYSFGGGARDFVAYHVNTGTITDFVPPIVPDSVIQFDFTTQTYVTFDPSAGSDRPVTFYTASGIDLATVPCSGASVWSWMVYSGSNALVDCRSRESDGSSGDHTLSLVHLDSGAVDVVASVHTDANQNLQGLDGYPDNG
jgi:hypothetical protein